MEVHQWITSMLAYLWLNVVAKEVSKCHRFGSSGGSREIFSGNNSRRKTAETDLLVRTSTNPHFASDEN
jgi:hypothetical protein